jgi:ankyrin repeat protein
MEIDVVTLMRAAQLGNAKLLATLIKDGMDPNVRDDKDWTALHWAAQEGHVSAAKILTEAGAKVDPVDSIGFTPLHVAVGEGHTRVVRHLLAEGADVNQRCSAQRDGTLLHLASAWNRLTTAKALIRAGANVNALDSAGRSPLLFAVKYGHSDMIKLLIKAGAEVRSDERDVDENKTLAEFASELRDPEVEQALSRSPRLETLSKH